MAKMIEPLKDRVSHIEKSNKILEEKGELISAMKIENDKLRVDCKLIKIKNRKLKDRLNVIENKLLENNIVVQEIPDQAWELSSNLQEKNIGSYFSFSQWEECTGEAGHCQENWKKKC